MVSMGAVQKLSPVWTPTASTFSMKQTVTIWFLMSRTTSTSNSSHPTTDSSTSTCPTRLARMPRAATICSSSLL
ncbi:MAG: hypothetical protein BWY79_01420 [Actinobacteria bacterium ADurb.Bin444]|nr:MAG: hypothetical protein BWY79_01420 [Actinobacteria bacterium ADurb.Bin444]